MFTLKHQPKFLGAKKSSGFTIVELLIVIVVIGILATLVIVTFTGIQQKGRNSQRQTDLKAVQSHIAAFYADKGYYPTEKDLSTPSWVAANLKGLDPEALRDPKQAAGQTIGGTLSSSQYSYKAEKSDPASTAACDDTASSDPDSNGGCDKYTLQAKQEGSSDITLSSN